VPTQRHRKLAHDLVHSGKSIYKVMLENGYSEWVARLGMNGVPKTVLALMPKESNLVALGSIEADLQEKLVRGRLVMNTIQGTDRGVNSAHKLGMDKRISMFQPDIQAGVIVLAAPNQAVTNTKVIDAVALSADPEESNL
jgi:hypothetical protein